MRLADHACAQLAELRTLPLAPRLLARAYADAQQDADAELADCQTETNGTTTGPSGAARADDACNAQPGDGSAGALELIDRPSARRRLA